VLRACGLLLRALWPSRAARHAEHRDAAGLVLRVYTALQEQGRHWHQRGCPVLRVVRTHFREERNKFLRYNNGRLGFSRGFQIQIRQLCSERSMHNSGCSEFPAASRSIGRGGQADNEVEGNSRAPGGSPCWHFERVQKSDSIYWHITTSDEGAVEARCCSLEPERERVLLCVGSRPASLHRPPHTRCLDAHALIAATRSS